MIEIKVTVETPDILSAAMIIAEALKGRGAETKPADTIPAAAPQAQPAPAPAPEKPKAAKKTAKKAEKAPAPAQPAPAPAPVKEVTLDMLTKAGAELVDKGFMTQVLAIMDDLKVPSLLELSKELFPVCAEKFHELDPSVI